MDRLDRIRIFHMVVGNASFAEAGRKLGIPPVAVSRAVAALEKELRVTLLRRTTRSVGLTKQGADYLARSRRALAELDDKVSTSQSVLHLLPTARCELYAWRRCVRCGWPILTILPSAVYQQYWKIWRPTI